MAQRALFLYSQQTKAKNRFIMVFIAFYIDRMQTRRWQIRTRTRTRTHTRTSNVPMCMGFFLGISLANKEQQMCVVMYYYVFLSFFGEKKLHCGCRRYNLFFIGRWSYNNQFTSTNK